MTKIQKEDFIPLIGMIGYVKRSDQSLGRTYAEQWRDMGRATILGAYNIGLAFLCEKGLEKLTQ
jgi:hypothetical protein